MSGNMGNTLSLAGDDVIVFVERRQQDGVEVDGPDAVFGFFEPDVLIDHGVGEIEQTVAEAEGAAGRDLLHEEVPGVLEGREAIRVGTRGRCVAARRRLLPETFVRPLGVVLTPEGVEVALLGGTGLADGLDRLAFERAMHAFMRPVVLRTARVDPLVHDAEAHPPDVEIREAMDRLRGERDAVVGADRDSSCCSAFCSRSVVRRGGLGAVGWCEGAGGR